MLDVICHREVTVLRPESLGISYDLQPCLLFYIASETFASISIPKQTIVEGVICFKIAYRLVDTILSRSTNCTTAHYHW